MQRVLGCKAENSVGTIQKFSYQFENIERERKGHI
jgi:hypothetical protein